jgi:glyceraldehyde 3-phosphate dehydrogenase
MAGIAIHGFGRIGRSTLKAALRDGHFVPVSVSDIRDTETFAALFKADTNYGLWPEEVKAHDNGFVIGGREIQYVNSMDELPDWSALGVDWVIDCTGRATTREGAQAHIDRGAQRVIVSAPSKSLEDCDAVLLPGVNLDQYDPERHKIISMASCTTNSLATVIKILQEQFELEKGFFTTVHAYTNSQALTDQPMKDRRDSWAAAENIIPSSSGAAKALQFIWPNLNVTGKAYRVPARTGSIAELNATVGRPTSADELRDAFRAAARGPMKGVMDVLEEEWSSTRIIGDPHAALVDLPLINVLDGTLITVASWYDNEMGYSSQLAASTAYLASR